jgi:hypothetical protein
MKKTIALLIITAAASISFAQSYIAEKHGRTLIEGRPFITDESVYNSYDLFGSRLGLFGNFFSDDSLAFTADFGYRYHRLGDQSGHYLSGQTIRMGDPERAFFELFYGADLLSHKNTQFNNTTYAASLPLHRFGLALAARTASGSFGSSLVAEGYMGTQRWENAHDYDTRAHLGLEKLRLDFGSEPHPLIRVNFYIGATLRLDTLFAPQTNPIHEDRSAQMNLPEIGANINFGGEDVPVNSNLSVLYASSRFVYTSKEGIPGRYGVDGFGNEYAIMNDSLHLIWMAQGEIPLEELSFLKPGLLLGFTSNSGKMYQPHVENDPIQLGGVILGHDYSLTGFHFGVGAGLKARHFANLHLEYIGTAWSLKCGNEHYAPEVPSRVLHHFSVGVSTMLHQHVRLPLDITKRVAFFSSGSSGIIAPRHAPENPINIVPGQSKNYLYGPHTFLSGFERTTGIVFGVDGQAFENKLEPSLWMAFLSNSGMELGVSVKLSL